MADGQHDQLTRIQPGLLPNVDLGGQAGLATYVAAAIFGNPSMPRETPDWLKASVESQANFAQRLPGADTMTIGGAGGGPLDAKTKEERQRDAEAEAVEDFAVRVEQVERERQHETQWLSETHSYAGKAMTGAEWHEMTDWFHDSENVADWEDAMMTETGESREEVRRTGGKMKRFYDLMDKDAKGTISKDEKTEFTTLERDKEVKQGLDVQQEVHGLRAGRGLDHSADTEAHLDGSQRESIATRSVDYADAGSAGSGLAGAQSISSGYRDAALGIPTDASAAPLKSRAAVAGNTVQVSPANMFG